MHENVGYLKSCYGFKHEIIQTAPGNIVDDGCPVSDGGFRNRSPEAVYADDRAIASRKPETIVKLLLEKHKFKLTVTGSISYHLGMEFFRDNHGVLSISAKRYVEKMLDTYK